MAASDPQGSMQFWVDGSPVRAVRKAGNEPGSMAFWVDGAPAGGILPAAGGGNVTMAADAGTFVLTGVAAGLRAARNIAADAGSFVLTGQTAGLRASRRMPADAGAFSLSGQTAGLQAARRLVADAGVFTLTGAAATLVYSGDVNLTGQMVGFFFGLTYSGEAAATLVADPGAFVLTGQPAGLRGDRRMIADPGAFVLSGQAVALRAARRIAADTGVFVLAGQPANLLYGNFLIADPGAFALTGADVTFHRTYRLVASAGIFTLIGANANLVKSGASPVIAAFGRPNLFKANIASAIYSAMRGQMLAGVLTRATPGTRSPGSLTAGLQVGATTTTYTCEGFTEDYTERQIDGTLIRAGDRKLYLFGKSLPDAVDPRPGDVVRMEGVDWKIVGPCKRDPAGAGFVCQVRR